MTLLSFHDVTCVRGGRVLFDAMAFALGAGDALLVTGVNGSGKSSLIRLAAGLLAPAAGTVERPARAALLAEGTALDGERRVEQALAFWARMNGDGGGMAAAEALDAVGLAEFGPVPARLLSTGQRRRVALARVLMTGAPLWLLDEPANGLDADAVTRLDLLIARHRAAGGAAMVASHLPLALPGATGLRLGG